MTPTRGHALRALAQPAVPTEELAEFLSVVAACSDVATATAAAAESIALALDAEAVAVVVAGVVETVTGFPRGQVPLAAVQKVADGRRNSLVVPGAGRCYATAVPVGVDGRIVAARSTGALEPEEIHLLFSMGRVLELILEMLRTLEAERLLRGRTERQAAENRALLAGVRDRQRLLEQLADVQRAIARRLPLTYVIGCITQGAQALLGSDCVALVMEDDHETDHGGPLAGWSGDERRARSVVEMGSPLPRRSMRFPVHESGGVVGCLVAADWGTSEPYTEADRTVLLAYAEHASLALTDARTLETLTRAFHDPLTGLATRALFNERLEYALAGGARRGAPVSLLFVDLDRFKLVNDTLGHAAGDALLVGLADRLRTCLRSSDTAARFGGDEFVLLLDETDEEGAELVAGQILEAVREPFLLAGQHVYVDASIGIAVAHPDVALRSVGSAPEVRSHDVEVAADALLRSADVAMYRAKRGGKGRAEVFRPEMSAGFAERLDLESGLREAMTRGELEIEYQPVVRLSDSRIIGAEALLRWRHPRRGLVGPEEFVPVAEETGLIVPIGQWVLREACAQAARWNRSCPSGPIPVAVNLSARQLELPGVTEDVMEALTTAGLAPELLCLELTETLLVRDLEPTAARLRRLKELGVTLAVDDFGTGYSSLAHLWSFPIDALKIDRSFVASMGKEQGEAFVCAIVDLARALNLRVVAEGIEEQSQLDILRRAHCDSGQGALFSWSVRPEEFEAMLERGRPFASTLRDALT